MDPETSEKRKIDALDRKIILELQEDARRQFKTIATKLNVSEKTVKNREGIGGIAHIETFVLLASKTKNFKLS